MCYTYDKSKGGDTRELQSRMVPPNKKWVESPIAFVAFRLWGRHGHRILRSLMSKKRWGHHVPKATNYQKLKLKGFKSVFSSQDSA